MYGDAILSLRPTNAMHQLGVSSRVPLYSLKQLSRGSGPLWIPNIPQSACAAGLLRAASHVACPVGLALAPKSANPDALKASRPAALFHVAVSASSGLARPAPFLLHAQAPALDALDSMAYDAVRSFLGECLQLGFTSFGLDLGSCDQENQPELIRGLLSPVLELELGMALRLRGQGEDTDARAQSIRDQVSTLLREGLRPQLLVLDAVADLGEQAWTLLAEIRADLPPGCFVAWDSLKGVDRAARSALGEAGLKALAADDLLARRFPEVDGETDEDRLEALTYAEAISLLEKLGSRRSIQAWARQVLP